MGWIPSNDEILSEVATYNELSFFKKSKNSLVIFVLVVSALSFFLMGAIGEIIGSDAIYGIVFNIFLTIFIFLNHRWAMFAFCAIYLIDKIIFILAGAGSPVSQIIFGALAVLLTYSSVKVATELKKSQNKSVTDV